MQKPNTPMNEAERLFALKNFNILDTLPEEIFDHYTVLASQICGTPIALISLIDENRQWFKSKVGLEVSETPRDISLCGHTILQDDIFEIKDALADERFSYNPLITAEPKIRFYAGMPITTREGYNLGTVCVIDTQPRLLTDAQRDALKRIAKLIMSQIEQRLSQNTIMQLNKQLYENSQFIQTLIDNIPAFVSYWNHHQECVFANNVYQTHLGLDPQLMRGKQYLDVIPEFVTNMTYQNIQKVLQGESQSFQTARVLDDGSTRHCLIRHTPHFDSKQNVIGFFTLVVDITEIKTAEKKINLSESALNSASEAILITDANNEICYVNDGFTNITGYSAAEALGNNSNFIKSDVHSEAFFDTLKNTIKDTGFWQGNITNKHKNGTLYTALMTIDSIKDETGEVSHYVASMIDMTESQKVKDDLAIMSAMLLRTGKMANIGGWEYDFHTEKILWSDQMYAIHEIDNLKVPDIDSAILFYQVEARDIVRNAIENCIKEGTPWDLELPFTTAKGRNIWVRTIGEVIKINGVYIKLAGTCQDITEKKIQEQEAISREVSLRNNLIREVHHHIKNNIQGISGLLFNAAEENSLLLEPINAAINKLNSIAVIHGLQGMHSETRVDLHELLNLIAKNIETILHVQIAYTRSESWLTCYLEKNEAVPMALILNELMTNAIKHGAKNSPVQLNASQATHNKDENKEVLISVANKGTFNLNLNENPSINQNGLKLVTSLMPKTGAYLSFQLEDNESQVNLVLKYPIISYN